MTRASYSQSPTPSTVPPPPQLQFGLQQSREVEGSVGGVWPLAAQFRCLWAGTLHWLHKWNVAQNSFAAIGVAFSWRLHTESAKMQQVYKFWRQVRQCWEFVNSRMFMMAPEDALRIFDQLLYCFWIFFLKFFKTARTSPREPVSDFEKFQKKDSNTIPKNTRKL